MRKTTQRREILRVLEESGDHPTASEVYDRVRRRLPRISLGTVYRNLDRLCDCDEAARIEVPGREMRFDADTSRHLHLRCVECGRVVDVDPDRVRVDIDYPRRVEGMRVTGCCVQLLGRCESCPEEAPAAETRKETVWKADSR